MVPLALLLACVLPAPALAQGQAQLVLQATPSPFVTGATIDASATIQSAQPPTCDISHRLRHCRGVCLGDRVWLQRLLIYGEDEHDWVASVQSPDPQPGWWGPECIEPERYIEHGWAQTSVTPTPAPSTPPWSEIEVFGVKLPKLREVFSGLGATEFPILQTDSSAVGSFPGLGNGSPSGER